MGERLNGLLDGLRTQLWPMPLLGIAIGLALGIGLPRLDAHVDANVSAASLSYVFGGGSSAARTVLGTIATSLITVTSLTFSLTVVTLQLASSQFSPRLLRTFTRDRFVHLTLALFLGTFTFALAVLRTVRDETNATAQFVPRMAVTVAFVLAIASVIGLVLFLAHLAREIRVETMVRTVQNDASDTIRRVLVDRETGRSPAEVPRPPADAVSLLAISSGFLVAVDEAALLSAAGRADAVIDLDSYPGCALVAATPIGEVWPTGGGFDSDALEDLRQSVGAALSVEFERNAMQDYAFGLRQLVDVSIKALSPGINDPTTAVHALTRVSVLLCELAGKDLGPRMLEDEDRVRVVLHPPDFAAMLELAMTQPRRYGATDPVVMGQLLTMLREVGWCTHEAGQQRAVTAQLERLRNTVADQDFDHTERVRLAELAAAVEAALARRATTAEAT